MTAAVHKWEICFEGDLLVFPIKTSIEVVKLIREGGGLLSGLKCVMVCMPRHMRHKSEKLKLFICVCGLADSPPQDGPG